MDCFWEMFSGKDDWERFGKMKREGGEELKELRIIGVAGSGEVEMGGIVE